jgi:hypothetical protein
VWSAADIANLSQENASSACGISPNLFRSTILLIAASAWPDFSDGATRNLIAEIRLY